MSERQNTKTTRIVKADEDRQLVYGEVYAPYRIDTHGEMMRPEDVETMAHRFMQLPLSEIIDRAHDNNPVWAYPVESFIARDGDPDFTPGAWVLGLKIEDSSVWAQIQGGYLNGFSFECFVRPAQADVQVAVVRDHVGKTEVALDHDHFFFLTLNDDGTVHGGRTSEAADGHYHEIVKGSVTKATDEHTHRYFL